MAGTWPEPASPGLAEARRIRSLCRDALDEARRAARVSLGGEAEDRDALRYALWHARNELRAGDGGDPLVGSVHVEIRRDVGTLEEVLARWGHPPLAR